MWTWKHPDWPNYSYDASIFTELVESFYLAAERLTGRIEGMSDANQTDTIVDLMLSEAITTNAIEGENLDRDSVRSSLLKLIGIESSSPTNPDDKASGAAALMVDVRRNWGQPLTHDLLGRWQTMACPATRTSLALRGAYRVDAMQIVSGPYGRVKVHYEAPPASTLPEEMDHFLNWYNQTNPSSQHDRGLPGPIRSAIAHLWFETIHPFDDGNGRVGRAIADHALSQALGRPTLACLASAINEDRKSYYAELERASKGNLNIDVYLAYFTKMINKAQEIAREEVDFVLNKARFYDAFSSKLNSRQERAIARVYAEGRKGFIGGLSSKKYAVITKCSSATATRDLTDLVEMGAAVAHGAGRSRRYELVTLEASTPIG